MIPTIYFRNYTLKIYILALTLFKLVFTKDVEQEKLENTIRVENEMELYNATQEALEKEEKSNAAITVILALYGIFVVALVIFHCWLNRSEDMKNEKSRDAKEKADFDKSHAEERRRKMKEIKEEKGGDSIESKDVVHFEHEV